MNPRSASPAPAARQLGADEAAAHQHVTHTYVGAFVDELARAGLRHVCMGPGSRSTPLAMMCAQHPRVRVWMHVDERSAAYFALGMARTLGEPVALVCTSGTAAANFFPAVVEACLARVPLVVLTADRPHELRDVGAPQSIDQVRLYGSHVKWFVDMALPEATTPMLRYARAVASRAVAVAQTVPGGPVHVNFPLREPLVPLPGPLPAAAAAAPAAWSGREGDAPYTAAVAGQGTLGEAALYALAEQLASARRAVIVSGPDTPSDAAGPVLALAQRLGCPVLADPLSGLRTVPEAGAAAIIDAYDVFLRDQRTVAALDPDLIVRFGALPVSKPLLFYMERYAERRQLVVDPGAQWRDPILAASQMVYADPAALCQSLCQALDRLNGRLPGAVPDGARTSHEEASPGWLRLWQELNEVTRTRLREQMEALNEPFEGRVFHELASILPEGTILYVGNSMPIRDMDAFFPAIPRRLRVLGNRGASGIDGVVSSALGAAAAADSPVVLVLGDLSFYHDLNGLLAAKVHGLNVTIVVINNDGGGIFSFLPQAAYPEHFETLFGTPTGLDFRPVVEMYGGQFARPEGWEGFRAAVRNAVAGRGLHVIEVVTERARNVTLHRHVFAEALQALGPRLAQARGAAGSGAGGGSAAGSAGGGTGAGTDGGSRG